MLFDLKGKRRRAVQATYLGLAILIGLGLVGFGIGSSTNGGLGDLFGNNSGSGNGNSLIQKQIDTANKQLQANPQNQAAMKAIVRGHYQLASQSADPNTGAFNKTGKQELAQAGSMWQRYLAATNSPDPGLAALMVQAYAPTALNQPTNGLKAAEIVAAANPTSNSYLNVIQYAALAHDTRTVELASNKALQLAPPGERATVKQQISAAKAAGSGQTAGATGGGVTTAP